MTGDNAITNSFDLFISYHSEDKAEVKVFVDNLQETGLRIWFDEYHLPLGQPFAESLEDALKSSAAIAVLVGPSGIGPWTRMEINGALAKHVNDGARIIPILLPGSVEKPKLPAFLECFPWLNLSSGFDMSAIGKLKSCLLNMEFQSIEDKGFRLDQILFHAKKHLVITAHTLNKFSEDSSIKKSFKELLKKGVTITVIQLNPFCKYASAHQPYHEMESSSSAREQHQKTLEFFQTLFKGLTDTQKSNLEVLFTNYMPRYRAIIVDETVYLYLYAYGVDVGNSPDMILKESAFGDQEYLRQKIIHSAVKMIHSPEIIPFIRCNQIITYWDRCKLMKWDNWNQNERLHHRLTHQFYVTYAEQFDYRFGFTLEREVKEHLKIMCGKTLVVGCGSGKEVEYISQHIDVKTVYGLDFSHVAIELAKKRLPELADQFLLGDFYDLDQIIQGKLNSLIANASFVHLYNREDIDDLLKIIHSKLDVGGYLFLRCLYKEKNGKPIDSEIDDSKVHLTEWKSKRWFVYYSRADLVKRCKNCGFEIVDDVITKFAHEHHFSNKQLEIIFGKGFFHTQYQEVFWPMVLARKIHEITES